MSVYLRIKHRFGPRMTEWVVAVQTMLWGLVLMLPAETFAGEAWVVFRSLMPEWAWGVVMWSLGVARIVGLVVNGARKNVTPWIRVASAGAGFIIFVGISVSFSLSGVISTWLAIYPVLAGVELLNIYRAAHDVGENQGATA